MTRQLDKDLPITDIHMIDEVIAELILAPGFRTIVLVAFTGTAFLLPMIGIYGEE